MQNSHREQSDRDKKREMRQIIKQAMDHLKQACAQNHKLRTIIEELKNKVDELTQKLKTQEKKLIKIQQDKSALQEKITKMNLESQIEKQKFKYDIDAKQKQLEKQLKLNQLLEAEIKKKDIQIQQLSKVTKLSKSNLTEVHSHIDFLKKQLEGMRHKYQEKEVQHQQEIQELKDLNKDIKRKFEMIEKQYTSILKLNDDQRQYQSPISIPKIKITNDKSYEKSTGVRQKKMKKSTQRFINPEMSVELEKIKQQIAYQYNKLNTTKESMMSARVSQTLDRIDTIISQLSCCMDEDSSDYV